MAGHKRSIVSADEVARIGLFSELGESEKEDLARSLSARYFDAHSQIVSLDQESRDTYFVLQGTVRATYYSANGREVAFADLQTGEMFGVLSALDSLPRSIEVVAVNEALIAHIDYKRFNELLLNNAQLAVRTALHLAALVRSLTSRVVEFSTLGVNNRIHAELLRLANSAGIHENRSLINPLPTHADIASRLSTNREAVTRELSALQKKAKLIQRQGRRLEILDVDKLQRIVRNVIQG